MKTKTFKLGYISIVFFYVLFFLRVHIESMHFKDGVIDNYVEVMRYTLPIEIIMFFLFCIIAYCGVATLIKYLKNTAESDKKYLLHTVIMHLAVFVTFFHLFFYFGNTPCCTEYHMDEFDFVYKYDDEFN